MKGEKGNLQYRKFGLVFFSWGFGAHRPYFIARHKKTDQPTDRKTIQFKNGLTVNQVPGMYRFHLGEIVERGNMSGFEFSKKFKTSEKPPPNLNGGKLFRKYNIYGGGKKKVKK